MKNKENLTPLNILWNINARKHNTNAFISTFKREPKNYQEVHEWMQNLINECDKKPLSNSTIEQYESLGIKHDGYKIIGFETNKITNVSFPKRSDYEIA